MKKLNTLIKLEKEYVHKAQELRDSYKKKTEDYIQKSTNTLNQISDDISQKHLIITQKLESQGKKASPQVEKSQPVDSSLIKSIILEYINQ